MKLSPYFSRSEFACQCGCGYNTVDAQLIEALNNVREHFGAAVTITSAARCEKHNNAVGGSPKSQHRFGRAADIQVKGVDPKDVHAYLEGQYGECYGLGKYDSFTHIDTRDGKARWDLCS